MFEMDCHSRSQLARYASNRVERPTGLRDFRGDRYGPAESTGPRNQIG